MWFKFAHFVCTISYGLQALICWRLLKQGRTVTFINLLLAIHFLISAINSNIYIYFFFKIGHFHFFAVNKDPEDTAVMCKYYITSWLVTYTMMSIPNIGIVFCRFIYARYAHGLVKDMGRLFHKIVLFIIFVFTGHWLLVWPIRTTLSKGDYTNIMKGKICNQIPFSDSKESIIQLLKPKLMTCFMTCLYTLALVYIYTSAKRQRSKYSIPRTRWNLINIDQHFVYILSIIFCLLFDQLVINVIIQVFHSQLGEAVVFQIWWIWHLVMFIIINVMAPLAIIHVARTEYSEFTGLRGRRFPGQEKPRVQPIVPYRHGRQVKEIEEIPHATLKQSHPKQPIREDLQLHFISVEIH